jgi:membrane protein
MRWVWHLGGLSVWELGRRVWSEVKRDDVLGRAAQLSFYFLLALFPLLIFISAVIGRTVAGDADLYRDLIGYLASVMPASAFQLVRATLDEIAAGASGGKLSAGLVAALWTASSGMEAVINGLNVAYEVKERRRWWKRRLVAITLTVVLAIVTVVALGMAVFGGRIGWFLASSYGLGDMFAAAWVLTRFLLVPVFLLFVFALIYRFAPNVRGHGWQALMPGALTAVVLWLSATTLFRLYLVHFDTYSRSYGSLGAVIVLMMWLYMCSLATLAGGEVNSEIRKAAAAAGAAAAQAPVEAPSEV